MSEKNIIENPDDREIFEALLNMPGSFGDTYSRFHPYSLRNLGFLALQGCPPEPLGTFKKWQELGGHVKKGSSAYSILRPILVRKKDEDGEPTDERFTRFKVVKALFPLSMTSGAELPPYEPPNWSKTTALDNLDIQEVPFENYDGNVAGYSYQRNIAINPLAKYPFKTTLHEIAHIELGHTAQSMEDHKSEHRGLREFEAESTAVFTIRKIGGLALERYDESASRAYIQHWMKEDKPSDTSVKRIFKTSDAIHKAGLPDPELSTEADNNRIDNT